MINVKDHTPLNLSSSNTIDNQLESIEIIISYQKEEIIKSESSILLFEKCLVKQNEVLSTFIKERQKLETEREKRVKLSIEEEKKCQDISESPDIIYERQKCETEREKRVKLSSAKEQKCQDISESPVKQDSLGKTRRRINRDAHNNIPVNNNHKDDENSALVTEITCGYEIIDNAIKKSACKGLQTHCVIANELSTSEISYNNNIETSSDNKTNLLDSDIDSKTVKVTKDLVVENVGFVNLLDKSIASEQLNYIVNNSNKDCNITNKNKEIRKKPLLNRKTILNSCTNKNAPLTNSAVDLHAQIANKGKQKNYNCKYYQMSSCLRGEACRYLHQVPPNDTLSDSVILNSKQSKEQNKHIIEQIPKKAFNIRSLCTNTSSKSIMEQLPSDSYIPTQTQDIIDSPMKLLNNSGNPLFIRDNLTILPQQDHLQIPTVSSRNIIGLTPHVSDISLISPNGDERVVMEKVSSRIIVGKKAERLVLKRKNNVTIDANDCIKKNLSNTNSNIDIPKSLLEPMGCVLNGALKEIQIPFLKDKQVNHLLIHNGCIICGNKGLLIRHNEYSTIIYKTKTNKDIIYAELVNNSTLCYLVAFTVDMVIIFDINETHSIKTIDLSGINLIDNHSITYNSYSFLIASKNGLITKIDKDTWRVSNTIINNISKSRYFFPATLHSRYRLVKLTDDLLYTTEMDDMSDLNIIPGIINAKAVLNLQRNNYICYSDDTIWFLDQYCCVFRKLSFKFGIKLLEHDHSNLVVLDWNSTIHVHSLREGYDFGAKMFERGIDGNISAISITGLNVSALIAIVAV